MNRHLLWRYILLTFLILVGVIYALPNLYGEDPAVQISAKEEVPITTELEKRIASNLTHRNISFQSFQRTANAILVRFPDTEDQIKAKYVIQETIGADYSVALNLAPCTPKWLQAIGAKPMRLGLDLQGGIHFLLDVDVDAIIKNQESGDAHSMVTALRSAQFQHTSMISGPKMIIIHFRNIQACERGINLLKKQFRNYQFEAQGLSVRGIISKETLHQIQQNAVDQIIAILQTRVNELGVSEPVIQQQGKSQISVDLPGIEDTARAKDIIGKVATIFLQLVDVEHDAQMAARTGIVPVNSKLYTYGNEPILLKQKVVLNGTSIINASSVIGEDGHPDVQIRISGGEVSSFNQITKENVGKLLAVVYVETKTTHHNGKAVTRYRQERIINIATIQTALGNNFQITNLPTMEYAKNLALLLRSGTYPVPVDFVQERVVGPSLGQENIHMGIFSAKISVLLIILFMAFYYRLFGIIADIALILNVIFIIAVLSILGATLTLPSIAGIVLIMGMAVDANVLINERIREELRNGVMSSQASIKVGYDCAFSTIVDANVTTLIVMIVLFTLGPAGGPVQGFAVTTMIGILSSMLTAIFFTRTVVNLIYGRRSVSRLSIGIRSKFFKSK
ncbi:protein translocase subunit SecD [Coxiella endosymbiont of Dermacentor marginatus]|uniref:protein translocase subunit SecD n=1 Tax=Coxiella endosymbiont of Dermacentor marginatus TaxID=1656159 RepID=UPI002221E7E4|nr:protein translocase subunit SecD [Coxiella endosymbiont of Dermacentor marginatus]